MCNFTVQNVLLAFYFVVFLYGFTLADETEIGIATMLPPKQVSQNHNQFLGNGSVQIWKPDETGLFTLNSPRFGDYEEIKIHHRGRSSQILSRTRFHKENRGALGLSLLVSFIKGCLYYYTYFKLMCICAVVSVFFVLLLPFLPLLIPALILILLIAAGLSIAIPLIVAFAGGDDDLLLVTN